MKRPSSVIMEGKLKGSLSISQPGSFAGGADLPPALAIEKYEPGRAEALGALCRIVCAKKTGEEILPVYLARLYLAVQQGLQIPSNRECGETIVAIILNSQVSVSYTKNPRITDAVDISYSRWHIKINMVIKNVYCKDFCG